MLSNLYQINVQEDEKDYWRALVNAALNLRVPQAKDLVNNN